MDTSKIRENDVDVVIQHPSLSVDPLLCRRTLDLVFSGEDTGLFLVTLIQADHATVNELNRTYLGHDYATDVLAFSYSNSDEPLEGEIYVDLDTAKERHRDFGTTFEQEALRYVVHGALHLAGYRDDEPEGKVRMHELEDRYLEKVGPF